MLNGFSGVRYTPLLQLSKQLNVVHVGDVLEAGFHQFFSLLQL